MPYNPYDMRDKNRKLCYLSDDPSHWRSATEHCKRYCTPILDQAKEEGRTTNYGCPPAYLLNDLHTAWINGGVDYSGHAVRYVPDEENRKAGAMWKGMCFKQPLDKMSDRDIIDKVAAAARAAGNPAATNGLATTTQAAITANYKPEFTITAWDHQPLPNDGLNANPCWPSRIAPQDPGFALNTVDAYYGGNQPPYNYKQPYVPGVNGV
ncbi:hypothetical protein VTJ49DRAFT_6539 [Mycothermus thermophilus]|uniref:Uncharacterized protein n=1 Tax=Humicola insolens TaxID=85995 RepID=A0ABR3V1P4_HUMIN